VGGSFDFTTFESVYIKLFVRILSKMYCKRMISDNGTLIDVIYDHHTGWYHS